ncbi:MAG: tRNA (adenosine(37)-N6)-threonylcarbamoyltransferase complex dimerization subunit type 1 TsaB [Negativicutes bacterium]|nr:tRNA (adenosine(37)-N6)-threonylcarbamoyltransferase complex dimerization subunit type 1 TsaB [Negativicutes bacterium]
MPILALDTATLVSSVALARRETVVAELTLQTRKTHSELLMPHIEQLLALAETSKEAVEAIAVSIGPGSFTGLRIGLATAKALAYALQIPLVGVPTLDALAYGCPVPGAVLAATMDAQKGNVYIALFRWGTAGLEQLSPPRVMDHNAAFAELAALTEPVVVLGEAVGLYAEALGKVKGVAAAEPHVAMPRAASVALLGWQLLDGGARHDVMTLEPLYIRRSEAEDLWDRRSGCR